MSAARVLDFSNGPPPLGELEEGRAIAIGRTLAPFDVIQMACDRKLKHIVQRDGLAFESEFRAAQLMLGQPHRFLRSPVESITGPQATWEVARSPLRRLF